MRGTWISRLRQGTAKLVRDSGGNAMMLTAAAIVPVVGIVGSGIDIGRAYMAQLRLQQACDAGVLAGRRYMGASTYTEDAKAEAAKMFDFNYPASVYGSEGVTFESQPQGTSDVVGTATARLPTSMMHVFGFENFDLTANCAAKLEISNADVMLVLDVTGSMDTVNSGDSVSRLEALKEASIDFFDTLTTAELGDGRLRFGVVPYSATVNVGSVLYSADPNWLSDKVTIPSRVPTFTPAYNGGTTTYGSPSNGPASAITGWSNQGGKSYANNSAACSALTPPPDDPASPSGSATSTQTGQYIDGEQNRITDFDENQAYRYKQYRYNWASNKCRLQSRTMEYVRATPGTLKEPPVMVFSYFTYQNRDDVDVSAVKSGGALTLDTGTKGVDVTANWDGCVMERQTTAFNSSTTAPSSAYDMDIDMVPTSDDATKWKLFLPDFAYSRNSSATTTSSSTSHVDSFEDKAVKGDLGACPVPVMKLTPLKAADRSVFVDYIGKLKAHGFTYHDSGMVWGARMISPTGLFASENATAPNNRPIARHILYMTDGDMNTPRSNYSHQGLEQVIARIGATSDSDAVNRHNNRFSQLCERAKAKNITVWVVSFGTSLTTRLQNCATPGKAYQANNAQQLNDNFQAIAREISKLRLSQ